MFCGFALPTWYCAGVLQRGILFFFVLFKFHILTIALNIYLNLFSPNWPGYSILSHFYRKSCSYWVAYLNCRWNSPRTAPVSFRSSNWSCAPAGLLLPKVLHGNPQILLSLTYWDKLWKVKCKCHLGYRLAVWPWANCFFSLGLSFLIYEAGRIIISTLPSFSSSEIKTR